MKEGWNSHYKHLMNEKTKSEAKVSGLDTEAGGKCIYVCEYLPSCSIQGLSYTHVRNIYSHKPVHSCLTQFFFT